MMWIHLLMELELKVKKQKYSYSVTPDRIFIPFHFAGHMEGVAQAINIQMEHLPYAVGESEYCYKLWL